jgi:hypothetical protein
VGSRPFVEKVKALFEAEIDDIGLEKSFFWDLKAK